MASQGEKAVELWIRAFRKRPVLTSVTTLLVVTALATAIIVSELRQSAENERRRSESLTYQKQLEALNAVEGSMKDLIEFVQAERQRLKETEDVLRDLKQEKDALTPVVEADRKTVRAIFELQAKMGREAIWWDRSIAFGLGLVASFIA